MLLCLEISLLFSEHINTNYFQRLTTYSHGISMCFFFVFQQSDPASKSSSSSSKTVAMFSNTIAIIFLALLALQSVDAWHPFGNSRDVRYANQPQNQNQNRVSSGDSKDSKVFFLKYFPFYNNSII